MRARHDIRCSGRLWSALSLLAFSCDATPADGTFECTTLADCKRLDNGYQSCRSLVSKNATKHCYHTQIADASVDGGMDAGHPAPRDSGSSKPATDEGALQDASSDDAERPTPPSPGMKVQQGGKGGSTSPAVERAMSGADAAGSTQSKQVTAGMPSAGSGGAGDAPSEDWQMLDCTAETTRCETFDEASSDGMEFGSGGRAFWCVAPNMICAVELQSLDGQGRCFVSNPARTNTPRIGTVFSKAGEANTSIQVEFEFLAGSTDRQISLMMLSARGRHALDLLFDAERTEVRVYNDSKLDIAQRNGRRLTPQKWTHIALSISNCASNECTLRVRIGEEELDPLSVRMAILAPQLDLYFGLGPPNDIQYKESPPDIEARYDNLIMHRTPL